ncbi:hypothetical protein [Amycolatopsis jejuensis]|uniref:hypothetical protein n=1 Tax=Amycolatopsis jejuensis TaxID=330084 RepID=UPI0005252F0B|nr:hypothetical protein [Amycolatopsis jejuensis]
MTDTAALSAVIVMGMWCVTAAVALRTFRAVTTTAINRAKPCDLAAVLGALPGVVGGINRIRLTARGLA